MTSDPIIQRLRSANPASAAPIENTGLLEAIVATPPDARSTQTAQASPRRRRSRPTWILALGVALTIGGATAWATGVPGALGLFQAASPGYDSAEHARSSPWHQDVVPGSVDKATSVTIPNVGEVELWFADSRQGGFCTAIRLPDGEWAGTIRPGTMTMKSPLDRGSTHPGCQATRQQANAATPGAPVFVIDGFDFNDASVKAAGPGRDVWRLYYGLVDAARTPVRVVDRVSGRSAPVAEGRLFALAIPDRDPTRFKENGLRLVAHDAHGRVVAGDPKATDRVARRRP